MCNANSWIQAIVRSCSLLSSRSLQFACPLLEIPQDRLIGRETADNTMAHPLHLVGDELSRLAK